MQKLPGVKFCAAAPPVEEQWLVPIRPLLGRRLHVRCSTRKPLNLTATSRPAARTGIRGSGRPCSSGHQGGTHRPDNIALGAHEFSRRNRRRW